MPLRFHAKIPTIQLGKGNKKSVCMAGVKSTSSDGSRGLQSPLSDACSQLTFSGLLPDINNTSRHPFPTHLPNHPTDYTTVTV